MANTVTGIVIGGFGMILIGSGCWFFIKQTWQLTTYESTSGEIIRSEIAAVDPPWFAPSWTGASGTEHDYGVEPAIEYKYEVNEASYTNDQIWPYGAAPMTKRLSSQNQNFANDIVDTYESGGNVTIYYDPDAPHNSFLLPERDILRPMLFVVFGLVAIIWIVVRL